MRTRRKAMRQLLTAWLENNPDPGLEVDPELVVVVGERDTTFFTRDEGWVTPAAYEPADVGYVERTYDPRREVEIQGGRLTLIGRARGVAFYTGPAAAVRSAVEATGGDASDQPAVPTFHFGE